MPALNALKAFEVAGRTGSFTRAAELLNVTQSAVSRQVRQLEEQLGESLLQRRHHHLDLTASGRVLLQALQQSFDKIEWTVRTIQEKPTSTACGSMFRPRLQAVGFCLGWAACARSIRNSN